jgi:hypothetical protein
VNALGLQQLPVADRAELAHGAIDRRDQVERTAFDRPHALPQRSREERVERGVGIGIRVGCLTEVDLRVGAQHRPEQGVAQPRLRAARDAVHGARQEVLRQEFLQERERSIRGARLVGGIRHRPASAHCTMLR